MTAFIAIAAMAALFARHIIRDGTLGVVLALSGLIALATVAASLLH